jgi:hypothetical protein
MHKQKGKTEILGSGIKSQFCCVMMDIKSHTFKMGRIVLT